MMRVKKKNRGGGRLGLEVLRRSPGVVKRWHSITRFRNRASSGTASRLSFWKVFKSQIYPRTVPRLTFYTLTGDLHENLPILEPRAEVINYNTTFCICSSKTASV